MASVGLDMEEFCIPSALRCSAFHCNEMEQALSRTRVRHGRQGGFDSTNARNGQSQQ